MAKKDVSKEEFPIYEFSQIGYRLNSSNHSMESWFPPKNDSILASFLIRNAFWSPSIKAFTSFSPEFILSLSGIIHIETFLIFFSWCTSNIQGLTLPNI
ncbi:hypothetical protein Glove_109g430 [Diversispora epigaea]|uniref:Uncharacterized protein n=1 Tax=Diversispora epigaea TaxID=1348612 RepID=A0A397J2P6_9GLOM|nr:hypothetical protein Glove_109g430 [Diversispora epigaea]